MSATVSAEVVANRRRWVEALESERFQQATYALRDGDARCCLGVACSLSGLGRWRQQDPTDDFPWAYVLPGGVESDNIMPPAVAEMYGLPSRQGELAERNDGELPRPGKSWDDYYDADDEKGWTFPEIAALLRSDDWFGPDLDRVVS